MKENWMAELRKTEDTEVSKRKKLERLTDSSVPKTRLTFPPSDLHEALGGQARSLFPLEKRAL